jgi:DNA/RNA-binding domain of Phe-tRNA-synthetase-like protein
VPAFRYDDPILERFPAVRGGVIHAVPVSGDASPEPLCAAFGAAQEATLEQIGKASLAEIPSIAAWRRAFAAFGVKPTQYRNAAEALLRRLTKQGTIPSINALVDLGNLVAMRHALPVAVFDQDGIVGGTTVRFATGEERFTDLGSSTTAHPEPGEVVFADDSGAVSARRWCWRQSAESAAGTGTVEILITVEGHHQTAEADVAAAVADLKELLGRYQAPAELRSVVLSPDRPETPW